MDAIASLNVKNPDRVSLTDILLIIGAKERNCLSLTLTVRGIIFTEDGNDRQMTKSDEVCLTAS